MKKIIYYLIYILLLLLINILPTSAKEIKTCLRTETNLNVRDQFIKDDNLDDILTTPCVDDMDKVYDFANLLTDEEENLLFQSVSNYIKKTGYDLVLVTTNENPKFEARRYADDFYDYNLFGYNETRDGLLILIDMTTRELYISTTGYAIKMYDDFRIDNILDVGYSYITLEKYYDTFSNIIVKVASYYDLGYPSSTQDILINENGDPYIIKHLPYQIIFITSCLITLVVSLIFYYKTRLKIKAISTIEYLQQGSLNLKTDRLVNTIVTKKIRPKETSSHSYSSSSRSSSSGGSSHHTSSSGSRHGGGGRHF